MVEKDMGERLYVKPIDRLKQIAAIGATSLSVANVVAACDKPREEIISSLPPLVQIWSDNDQMRFRAIYSSVDNDKGQMVPIMDTLPAPYSEALKHGINEPLAQLAITQGAVNYIGLLESHNDESRHDFGIGNDGMDAAQFSIPPSQPGKPQTKQIEIWVSNGLGDQHKRIFTSDFAIRMTVVHEAAHGLNQLWWGVLNNGENAEPGIMERIEKVKQTCLPAGLWLYRQTGKLIDATFSNIEKDPNLKACMPLLGNLAAAFKKPEIKELGEDMFKCFDEGHMMQAKFDLDYVPPGGHGYDHVGEVIASATAILALDPEYMRSCLNQQDPATAAILRPYIRATLDLSFYTNPAIEKLLRQNPITSQVIDELLAA